VGGEGFRHSSFLWGEGLISLKEKEPGLSLFREGERAKSRRPGKIESGRSVGA